MTICQSCGAERSDQDRFCRNCGVSVATSVGDLVDTRRFNPDAPQPATAQRGSRELTNPYYVPPAAAYPAQQDSNSPYQTASLRKKLFQRKPLWLMLLWLVSLVTVFGIGIGAREMRSRRNRNNNNYEVTRRVYREDAQNALGFIPGNLRDAGYPLDVRGIYVESLITDDGPAALANIQAGDVLTELNEQVVRNGNELGSILDPLKPGAEVPGKVYREGEIISLRIKLGDRSFPPIQPRIEAREQGYLGVNRYSRRGGVPGAQKWGVEIQDLSENGPADLGGLRVGDVITELNGVAVRTPGEFSRRIRLAKPRSKVTITYYRGNTQQKTELILGHQR